MYNTGMLKVFRKKIVAKFVLWGLLILILPAFVMWGGANLSQPKGKAAAYVGFINNKKISFEKLYKAMSGVRCQIILNYFNQPRVLEALLRDRKLLAKLGWDRIIMLDEAKKLKIKVTNREIINYIRSHPLFMRNGDFDENFYTYILHNSVGVEPRDFEEALRENIAVQKLGSILTKDLTISDAEIADEYEKEFKRIKITYFIITPKSAIDKVTFKKEAVKPGGAIENYLKEIEARKITLEDVEDIYKKFIERLKNTDATFSRAASSLGFEVKNSQALSRGDNLEDIGDVSPVIDAASVLKDFEISKPAEVKDGYIVFEIVERLDADKERFKKEKDKYAGKIREKKSNAIMEEWLRKLEEKTKPAIKFEEIEQYYR
jgi:hypothetical protein